jgi:PhzF family phenazine biosynthesis protein
VFRDRAFKQVDVFTGVPLLGNPVAVVLDGVGLDDAAMLRLANWTNLSETTFISPATVAGADYAVRIWTPQRELPFAGHPTLGSAFAALEAGIIKPTNGKVFQQCAVGLVEISVAENWKEAGLSFRLPRHSVAPAPDHTSLVAAIGGAEQLKAAPTIVDVGPLWVIVEFVSASQVADLKPDLPAIADYNIQTDTTGLTIFAETHDGAGGLVVRSFAPTDGLMEDPVCGSGNGAVAAYRLHTGAVAHGSAYIARQGAQMGRDGYVNVRIEGTDVHIGGKCVTCIDGVARL